MNIQYTTISHTMQLYDLQGFNVCHAKVTSVMQGRRAERRKKGKKIPAPPKKCGDREGPYGRLGALKGLFSE